MNLEDGSDLAPIDLVYVNKRIVGQRVVCVPGYTSSTMTPFAKQFAGACGTIVGHSAVLAGIQGGLGFWYFTPDDGPGMVIPVYPYDIKFLGGRQ